MKVPYVITFGPKCNKGLICYETEIVRRHVHNSLYTIILTYRADITGHVTKRNVKKYHRI